MGPRYCDEKKEDSPDGYCSNSVFKEYSKCASCLITNQENMLNAYSRSRIALKAKLELAKEVLEMVEDNRLMPHKHEDYHTRLCCLTELASEALKKLDAR